MTKYEELLTLWKPQLGAIVSSHTECARVGFEVLRGLQDYFGFPLGQVQHVALCRNLEVGESTGNVEQQRLRSWSGMMASGIAALS